MKERADGGKATNFVAFDCTSQEKAAHGHMVYVVQEVPFWAPFDAVFDTSCPGNERCAVEYHPNGKPTTSCQCLQNIVVCEKGRVSVLFPAFYLELN